MSTYLNLLRIAAAGTVFLSHLARSSITGGDLPTLRHSAHTAVIVFFVISGFVISHVAAVRETTLRKFAIGRTARILSVVLPALALTWAIDAGLLTFLGASSGASETRLYQLVQPWKYLPLFLGFATDFWFLNENVLSNVPFWSLSYEIWYYVAFAVAVFGRGWGRFACLIALAVLVGPRHLLLLPVWLLGCLVYRLHGSIRLRRPIAIALFAISGVGFLAFRASDGDVALDHAVDVALGGWPGHYLRYSKDFIGDSLLASMLALHLLAARHCGWQFGALARPIALGASITFTLYVTHYPLQNLWRAVLGPSAIGVTVATLASIIALSILTERRRHALRHLLYRLSIRLWPDNVAAVGSANRAR